jgi:hypothetical protein
VEEDMEEKRASERASLRQTHAMLAASKPRLDDASPKWTRLDVIGTSHECSV